MSDSDLLYLALLFSSNYGQKSHLGVLIHSLTWGINSAAELWKTLDEFSIHESLRRTKKQQHVCCSTDSYTRMSVVKHAKKAFPQGQATSQTTKNLWPTNKPCMWKVPILPSWKRVSQFRKAFNHMFRSIRIHESP